MTKQTNYSAIGLEKWLNRKPTFTKSFMELNEYERKQLKKDYIIYIRNPNELTTERRNFTKRMIRECQRLTKEELEEVFFDFWRLHYEPDKFTISINKSLDKFQEINEEYFITYPYNRRYISEDDYIIPSSYTDVQKKCIKRMIKAIYSRFKEHCKVTHHYFYMRLLGCPYHFLIEYIENQFAKEGLEWEHFGKYWHIDHKVPISLFDLTQESHRHFCFNYRNLQPLSKELNINKHMVLIYKVPMWLLEDIKRWHNYTLRRINAVGERFKEYMIHRKFEYVKSIDELAYDD